MSLLFDISPTDEPQPRKARKTARGERAVAAVLVPVSPALQRPDQFLGRLDDDVACLDQNCQGQCHDVTHKFADSWRIECCYCGTGQWIDAREEPEEGATECFTFPDGRFLGLRIEEAAVHPRWPEYCKYAAQNHAELAVRETCQKWLADNPAAC